MIFFVLLALDINSGIIEALLVILSDNDKIFLRQGNILNINVVLALYKGKNCIITSKIMLYGPKERFSVYAVLLILIVWYFQILGASYVLTMHILSEFNLIL